MSSVAENLAVITKRIREACSRVGREPAEVHLIGVTKTVALDRIVEGVRAGIRILGENYIQEARTKIDSLGDVDVSWHFIGHLQSNKAKIAVEYCDWIHTLDRDTLARELDRQAIQQGKRIPVLIQVNIGDEASKSGVSPQNLPVLFRRASSLEGLTIKGLMTLPPYFEDPELVRPYFQRMRDLLEQLRQQSPNPEELTHLSMGMSHDFEVAIEEGATFVRIGTALFGVRPN